jgi:sugar phosphate isomerase/epimerase
MFKIALQLYSLREQCGADLDNVLARVAEAGYDGVETHMLYDMPARELRLKFDKYGLSCPSMHVGWDQFKNDLDGVISDAAALGASFIIIPILRPVTDKASDVRELAGFVKENTARVAGSGLKWLFHNHSNEFAILDSGKDFFDELLENTEPGQIDLQVDTYWTEKAGVPVKAFIERVKPRIKCFHLKDHREIGAGDIDFPLVLNAARELGHEWLVVEQEEFDLDPFESIRISVENVKRMIK